MVSSVTPKVAQCLSSSKIPSDGLKGLSENWKSDLISGLLVSLIALPLCLGIAMASGFPAFGGVVTAIIGGLVVGPLCGSQLTIKGPAAGLIAIAIASVEMLGQGNNFNGYRYTLAVIVFASAIQIIFAWFKLGRFVDFFPASVVHGMLAAIGIIIFSKQIHPLLGVKALSKNSIDLLIEIPHSLVTMNPEVALIGVTSVLIVIFATTIFGRIARYFPGPLLAVLAGVGFCLYFDLQHPHDYKWYSLNYFIDDKYLVSLPQNFLAGVTFPDFSQLFSATSLQFVLMFALIGSLEAMLTSKAVDGLDPYKRKANMNRDLMAVGFGNLLCGFVGGLPMISEVVRSCANVSYGARTRWANFFHGAFLLIFVVLLAPAIHLIPIAALAGVLCVTGYRLAAPKHFLDRKEIGIEQLIIFVVTIIGTLMTDLLVGVFLGIIAKVVICAFLGAPIKYLFRPVRAEEEGADSGYLITLPEVCSFANVISFKRAIKRSRGYAVTCDFSRTILVEHTFMKQVRELEQDKERSVNLIGLDRLVPVSGHSAATRRIVPENLAKSSNLAKDTFVQS